MNRKAILGFILSVVLILGSLMPGVALEQSPKYVFVLIGDGLASSQRQIAEYYLQESNPEEKLVMNTFPVAGINTTHSANSLVTDSAAAATAIATGYKTDSKMISVLPDGTELITLIEAAEKEGRSTGLVSTTRLTHATPAAFAAHNISRNNENEIAEDIASSGVDFIAGGGYRHFVPQDWQWGKSKREDDRNLLQEMADKGYEVFVGDNNGSIEFKNFQPNGNDKVMAAFTYSHIPYEVDRVNQDMEIPSLAEMTSKAIESLKGNDKGFFIMVEGGRIDHACHINDTKGTVDDVLAFDAAVEEAYNFYLKHPDETLILVVGDHETGGMGLGFGFNYYLNLETLDNVKASMGDTISYSYKEFDGSRKEYFNYLAETCGLTDLKEDEIIELNNAMTLVDLGQKNPKSGSYDPVAVAVTHIISERANVYWTTYGHTGTAVPLSAIGVKAELFGGYKDNTKIGQLLADVLNYQLSDVK